MRAEESFEYINITLALCFTITEAIFLSPLRAVISLIILAPRLRQVVATSDLCVSIEIGIFILVISIFSTGISLSSSSFVVTPLEFGPLASAPISIISAPSFSICRAFLRAFLGSTYSPPSLKESLVIFKIPIISGRFFGN